MTNYKQPHKPNTTDIEEIVDQVMELIETHGHNTSEYAIYWDYGEPEELKKDITQTLKDYGDAVRGETLNDVEEALKQWWGKDLEEGHAYADDYIAEGTTLSGDIIPVIRSLKGNNE